VALVVVLAVSWGLVSCGRKETRVSREDIQRAQRALQPFKEQLQDELRDGLRGGPVKAIGVCRVKAPEIVARLSVSGVTMGRTSHRLCNPANAAEPWMEPLLAEFLEKTGDRTYRAVRLADGTIGYVEPIYVRPVCLSCHGKNITPAVAERLKSLYPQDHAKDFAVGELRGIYWVKLSPGAGN
jgi:Protein of unknown function (DUF3365)